MFRSALTIMGLLLQNFQNKAKYSAVVIHTPGSHMCYNSSYGEKLYKRESHSAELTELHCWLDVGWTGHLTDKERREIHAGF